MGTSLMSIMLMNQSRGSHHLEDFETGKLDHDQAVSLPNIMFWHAWPCSCFLDKSTNQQPLPFLLMQSILECNHEDSEVPVS